MEINIQEPILSILRKIRIPVTLFTVNGYQMKGRVTDYDRSVIVLQDAGKQMIVYKSAISTIIPAKPIDL